MYDGIIFITIICVIGVSYLICCIISLKKTIKDRRNIMKRRKLRKAENKKDPFLAKSNDNLVIVPLPKFALSKSNKNDNLNTTDVDIVQPDLNIQNENIQHKEGLRNFSYKLSMSGEYEHIFTRDHFQKMNKI